MSVGMSGAVITARRLRCGSFDSGQGPGRKALRPALDDADDNLHLSRLKLSHDLVGLPVLGQEVDVQSHDVVKRV
jgi:hypothetical protein